MNIGITIADFLVSQWVWGVTWGVYHVVLSMTFMTLLFKLIIRTSFIRALILTISAHVFAIALYSFIVIMCLMPFIDGDYYTSSTPARINPGHVSLYLGFIYSVFELLFLMIMRGKSTYGFFKLLFIVLISNCLAAGLISLTLPCM